MNDIIEKFKKCVVHIATPYSSGTGFILFDENIIVTNYHVVKNCNEVVVAGRELKKVKAKVLFIDPFLDVAFIKSPLEGYEEGPVLSKTTVLEGETVLAIGHPFGLKNTSTGGIVSKTERDYNNIKYFQIDAAINPGNSGGPLINSNGEIIGMNTFIIKEGDNLGFSLPHYYIRESIESYRNLSGKSAIRCKSCRKTLLKENLASGFCPNCGFRFDKDDINNSPFTPQGITAKIENIIKRAGFDSDLSRCGPMYWEVCDHNSFIKISFLQTTKFAVFDAPICFVPEKDISLFFEVILKENHKLENAAFSLSNNEVFLSALTFEDDFDEESGYIKFKELIDQASKYRQNLKITYDAKPITNIIE
jgi:serine protease Do